MNKTLTEKIEDIFYKILNQDKFPKLDGNYEDYLRFKETTCAILSTALTQATEEAKKEGARELAIEILGSNDVIDMDYVIEKKDTNSPLFWAEVRRIRGIAKKIISPKPISKLDKT